MRRIIIIFLILTVASPLFSQKERKYIRSGNKNYQSKDYNNSEVDYQKAIAIDTTSFAANYNLGRCLLQTKKI